MIDSVFGVGIFPSDDFEDGQPKPCVFVSDKTTWEVRHCCSDSYKDDTREVLSDAGLAEECEGIWSEITPPDLKFKTRDELIALMFEKGFVYSHSFEEFMQGCFEE